MGSIDGICCNFMKFLKSNDQGDVVESIFRPENSLSFMFQTLWSVPESRIFFRIPNPKSSLHRKGQREANMFREEGNRLYKEGKLDKALEAYNYSILSAPFSAQDIDDKGDKVANNPTESLSLGYANRSAVLFEMDRNAEAILDIDRAIKHGYQTSKLGKLYERKAKCLMKQNSFGEATQVLRTIASSTTNKKNNENSPKQAEKLLAACKAEDENYLKKDNGCDFSELFYTGPSNLFEPRCAKKVQRKGKQSQLSDAIKVRYTSSKGRHLVATRDILPGEVLLTEESQCSMVTLDAKQRAYCCNCLRRTPITLPCPSCSLVVFCSDACQKVATSSDGFHRKECPFLPSLLCMKPDVNAALAFRVVNSFPLSEITSQANASDGDNTTGDNSNPFETAFTDLNYNYETLFNLEGNLKFRNRDSLIEVAVNAVILVKLLLKHSSFFGDQLETMGADAFAMNNKNLIYQVGSQLMRIMLNVQCNSHCTKELHRVRGNVEASTMTTIGHSVFCILTLVNHSCAPNVFTSNLGNRKIMYSVSRISAGEELCDSYGERYVTHDKKLRQTELKETYFFNCNCEACLKGWPRFPHLRDEFLYKCQKCHKETKQEVTCPECSGGSASKNKGKRKNKRRQESRTEPVRSKETVAIITEYNHTRCNLVNDKSFEENVEKISNFVNYLQKYTVTPNKPLIEAQENLLRLFDLYGSQIILADENGNNSERICTK